jgi:glycosyltransferase involved in cell wall biosynthesis
LLPQSIDSLLRQTVKPEEIVILDNESTDNTKEVVSRYKECRYIKTTGFMGNFYKTYEIADKDYLMLFHDDDLLHPQYLEFAQSLIEKYKPALITTRYTRFNDNNLPILPKEINRDFYLFDNQKDLVRYMIGVEGVAYAPAIYRRDCFLKEDIEYYKYGKFNDWPFMAKMGFHGKTIITADENIFYARIHSGQDTRNNNTCISGQQIINWDKFFYQILGGDPLTSKSYHFLKSKYLQFTTEEFKKSCSIEELLNKFLEQCPNINSVYNRKLLLRLKHKIAVEKLHNKI